ncbi:hypothetical protein [Neobacillus cucumis]|uniref:hypothetical protein n=1 Tax=Neobacillus cucumis TaxID=1740721 RepID=UPI0019668015|nr:hypothetical protein [Neobacillus cucumis]MBM7654407.1 putative neutral ceramidase superfamily lipid hydrolase [Neobacillus cucumis]
MAFTIYSTITLLAVIYCTVRPKILNSLELTMIFLLVMYLDSNMMDLITLNIKGIILSKKSPDLFAFYLTFIVLYPLIISCSLDSIRKIQVKLGKVLMILLAVFSIVGLEQGLRYFKVLIYQNWNWSFDIIQWLCIYLITYFLHSLFRNLVLKELNH